MTTVSILVPFQPDGAERDRNWAWCRARLEAEHPDWELVEGRNPGTDWCKAAAVAQAQRTSTGDVFVVLDADVVLEPGALRFAVARVLDGSAPWTVPHGLVVRLNPAGTAEVMHGIDPAAAAARSANWTERPRLGRLGGGAVVLHRSTLDEVPLDARFAGWGQEDLAWALALRALAGHPGRFDAVLTHLWHRPAERMSRRYGNPDGIALHQRYREARKKPKAMRELVEEGRPRWLSRIA